MSIPEPTRSDSSVQEPSSTGREADVHRKKQPCDEGRAIEAGDTTVGTTDAASGERTAASIPVAPDSKSTSTKPVTTTREPQTSKPPIALPSIPEGDPHPDSDSDSHLPIARVTRRSKPRRYDTADISDAEGEGEIAPRPTSKLQVRKAAESNKRLVPASAEIAKPQSEDEISNPPIDASIRRASKRKRVPEQVSEGDQDEDPDTLSELPQDPPCDFCKKHFKACFARKNRACSNCASRKVRCSLPNRIARNAATPPTAAQMKSAKKAAMKKASEAVSASKPAVASGSGAGSASKTTSRNVTSRAPAKSVKKARMDIEPEGGKDDRKIQVHNPYIGKPRMAKTRIAGQTAKDEGLSKSASPGPSAKVKGKARSKDPTPVAPGRADEPSGTFSPLFLFLSIIIQ
jgi:hypothetical protein